MAENELTQGEAPPESFVQQVKDALEHLHDLGYLQRHSLAQVDEASGQPSTAIAGQRLRWQLVDAIEALNPGRDVPFYAPHARLYNLLTLHYVDVMTIGEAARELGISTRQALRGLRQGEKSVATVLWARRSAPPPEEPDVAEITSFQAEMARLESHPHPVDVRLLLQRAQAAVGPQAAMQGICFRAELPPRPVVLLADPLVAEQVLLNALSRAVAQAQPGTLRLELTPGEKRVSLTLQYIVEPEAANGLVADHVVAQLADRLKWAVEQRDRLDGIRVVTLHMAAWGPTVLVIDDNEGLVNLLERFLTDRACRVVAARNGQEGLRLARELVPDAIVLDVMMPEMHGWEVLQRLRVHPQTARVPVIICSVINNPDLAEALGASIFLPKPVRRADILTALSRLGVV